MTPFELMVLMMLTGKYVHTADSRGGGVIMGFLPDGTVMVKNDHFMWRVKPNEAWFVPAQPQVTVQTALNLIEDLAKLLVS